MKCVVLVLAVGLLVISTATADPPPNSTHVVAPGGHPDDPGTPVDPGLLGRDLDRLTGHLAPVTYAEWQLLQDGWRYLSHDDKSIGDRKIYQIPSQDIAYWGPAIYGTGMFAIREVTHRTVTYGRDRKPGQAPTLDKVKPSWTVDYTSDGDERVRLDYYWANVPVLVEIWEVPQVISTERRERVGVIDPP